MELHVICLLLAVLCYVASEAATVSAVALLATKLPTAVPAAQSSGAPRRLQRSKRCSCSTFLDEECVYFCHLDIIWINTPERTVPYGLGNPSRIRRALDDFAHGKIQESNSRCKCSNQGDKKCLTFCQTGNKVWFPPKQEHPLAEKQGCAGLGLKCLHQQLVNNAKLRRLRYNNNHIKSSFASAELKARLLLTKWRKLQRNRTPENQSSWDRLKMTW
ncbi:endothelin-1 [Latimeria chalumnae]|uniref:Endothelin-1 n=1 Tax=Latimeria chalumnae TaxID=7897 RepID=H3BAA4_LATCH|nr:PREDICTED: endothelin-1 [Latimeria chalumnae]|eukprot:XP_005995271.1 PREDICTED: endothelin-1 [Latimeria chalumnae]